jgi:hypothetical protein
VEAAPGVLANDTGAGIQAMLVTGAEHGTVALNADGSFIYIPESGYSGSDSFTYKLSDGIAESAAAMVTITTEAGGPCPAVKLYGEGSEQVEMLRQYRDEVLGQTAAGRRIIQGYYFLAASAEKMFEASPVLRRAARNTMDALLPLIQNRLN